MELNVYPALSKLGTLPQELAFERAIWGKVNGARSDYRWIARSPGFEGHRHEIEKSLMISREERPHKYPSWRCHKGFYYAVSSYPSQAKDATGRSGFLEKQVIECRAGSIPAALAALSLLPLVAGFHDDLATSHTGDPRWEDLKFVLSDLPPSQCTATKEQLLETIDKGRDALKHLRTSDLEQFFEQLHAGNRPALLDSENPLTAEALAVLLLSFSENKAAQLSLSGWIPSARTNTESLSNWDGLVIEPRLRSEFATPKKAAGDLNQGRRAVQLLRGLHASVLRIIDFADGPLRWSDTITSDLATFLDDENAIDNDALDQLKQAFQRVKKESEGHSELPATLAEARKSHLRSKANIIYAARLLLSPGSADGALEEDDKKQIVEIMRRWTATSSAKLKSRIDQILVQFQNGSPG